MIKIKESLDKIIKNISQYYYFTFEYPHDEIYEALCALFKLRLGLAAYADIENVEIKKQSEESIKYLILELGFYLYKLIAALSRANFRNKLDITIDELRTINNNMTYDKIIKDKTILDGLNELLETLN